MTYNNSCDSDSELVNNSCHLDNSDSYSEQQPARVGRGTLWHSQTNEHSAR